jgi:hypothetical protein
MSTAEQLGSFGSPPEGTPAELHALPSDAPEGAFFSLAGGRFPNFDRLRVVAQTPLSGDQLVMAALEELGLVTTSDFIDSHEPAHRIKLLKQRAEIERKVQAAYRYYREAYFDDYAYQKGFDTSLLAAELYDDEKIKRYENAPLLQTVLEATKTAVRPDRRTAAEAERITRILLRDEAYRLE